MKILFNLFLFISIPTFAEIASTSIDKPNELGFKEGGNGTIDENGNVVSLKANCLGELRLNRFIKNNELEQFYHLTKTYNKLTYKELSHYVIPLCILEGGEAELNQITGAPALASKKQERVAAWLPNFSGKPTIFLSESFIRDVREGKKNFNKNILGNVLFREVLHNELYKKSKNLSLSLIHI